MKSSHRVFYNTGILYIKLLVVMGLGLISVRFVLGSMGEVDFGIYSLVAGLVGMLAILNAAMTGASMRFMSYGLGSGDDQLIRKTFNTTLFLHIIIGALVVGIIELGGYFMFEYFLKIPEARLPDAKIVFHLAAATTFVTIVSVPYDAVINSHENLIFLSLVDIFGAVMKFIIAISLLYMSSGQLIFYGAALLGIQIVMRIIKQRYSINKYNECKLSLKDSVDRNLVKEILSFSGWNLLGSLASMSVIQIRSLLLNMFFGVTLNAANGVSMQVSTRLNAVSSSLTRAINPQLVKSEGGGDRSRMLRITEIATKYSIFLFALFVIPVIVEMSYLLRIWLKEIPEYSILFSQIVLGTLLIEKFSFEITSALRAVGKIRNFQIVETITSIMNIPVSYYLFKIGYPPVAIFIISLFLTVIVFAFRLYFGRKDAGLDIIRFMKNGLAPLIIPILISVTSASLLHYFVDEGFIRMASVFLVSMTFFAIGFYKLGMSKEESSKIGSIIKGLIHRKKKS